MTVSLLKEISPIRIILLVVFAIVANGLEVLGLSLFIPIIDLLQNGGSATSGISLKLFGYAEYLGLSPDLSNFLWSLSGLFLIKAALMMWLRYLMVSTASDLQHRIRSRLFRGFLDATVSYISKSRHGELLSALSEHTVRVSVALFLLVQLIALWITIVAYSFFVLLISWQLTLFSLLLGACVAPLIRQIGKKAQIAGRGYILAAENLQHHSTEALYGKKMINAMNWGSSIEKRFGMDSTSLRDFWQWMAFWSNSPGILMQPLAVGILSLIVIFSLRFNLPTALLGTFVLSFIRLIPNIQAAVSMGVEFHANKSSVQRIHELLEHVEAMKEPNGTGKYHPLKAGLALRDVCFSYDAHTKVLDRVNLDVPRGNTIALIGPSGSGKTTVVDLVLGLYLPDSGNVLLDGKSLSKIDLRDYRNHVAYVSQDSIMFHDTIRNNLTLGIDRVVRDGELREVCESAGAWEFVVQRKGKLDEPIGNRGVALSGGQRQRLALARALLRRPDILILDEATSALDQDGEHWIQRTLRNLRESGEVTIIVIAHRYSTIEHADSIYEIRDGCALCIGNWEQAKSHLLSAAPTYHIL